MNLLFTIFEGCCEEIMVRQQREEVLWWNVRGPYLRAPNVWWSYGNSWKSVGQLVHTGLDCWILSQNCRNILPWYTVAQLVSAQKDTLLWLAGWTMWKFEPVARLNIWWYNMLKRGFMYSRQCWKWKLARL